MVARGTFTGDAEALMAAKRALFALSRVLWVSEILLFFAGGALIIFSTSATTLLQNLAPRELRGRIMSVNTIAWQGLEYVGVLVTGALATVWTAPPVVVGAAVVMGITVIAIATLRREITRVELRRLQT